MAISPDSEAADDLRPEYDFRAMRGVVRGITVVDDYGHHPTEIRATLQAVRACRFQRVHVLFQPHRYTRTQALMVDFGRAFHQADTIQVADIYPASEPPIPGVTSETLVRRMKDFGHRGAHYAPSLEQGIAAVIEAAQPGDAIITLGAGSVSQSAETIFELLKHGV